jgi:hypothetical protein
LHALNRLEQRAHSAGPDTENAWNALSSVYTKSTLILAELAILENGGAADLIRFLAAHAQTRAERIAGVIECGGLYDLNGIFVEVDL